MLKRNDSGRVVTLRWNLEDKPGSAVVIPGETVDIPDAVVEMIRGESGNPGLRAMLDSLTDGTEASNLQTRKSTVSGSGTGGPGAGAARKSPAQPGKPSEDRMLNRPGQGAPDGSPSDETVTQQSASDTARQQAQQPKGQPQQPGSRMVTQGQKPNARQPTQAQKPADETLSERDPNTNR